MSWLGNDKNWFPDQTKKKLPRPEEKNKTELNASPSVDYGALKCPICKSRKCPAYSSDPPIRYHRCENGHNFKSIEK